MNGANAIHRIYGIHCAIPVIKRDVAVYYIYVLQRVARCITVPRRLQEW
jgi:hypothetical protein